MTLSISDEDKAALEELAREFGIMWGDRPNVSRLIEAVAKRRLILTKNNTWTQSRIEALDRSLQILTDAGQLDAATEIADLLQERSETNAAILARVDNFRLRRSPWQQRIYNYIHRQQAFRFSYRDAAARLWQYTVVHAQIMFLEQQMYLVCRCREQRNEEIPPLQHNWILRLDHIAEAAVVAIDRQWEPDLERLQVKFYLYGELAFAYQPQSDDLEVSQIEGDPPVRSVVRNIFSSYWFFRDIARYWQECVIIEPAMMRSLLKDKVVRMYEQYNSLD